MSAIFYQIFILSPNCSPLKETQTFKAYWIESYKYYIIIAGRTEKYWKLMNYRTKCCYLSLLFSLLIATCASFAFLNGRVFSVLGHSFEHHKWSFMLYIVSFSALKISFSKLSLAKYHCLHKKPYIFHVFSYHRTSLQISLL